MNITVFQSDKGDCLLVTGEDEKRVLVDGGMPKSFTAHVSPFLNELQKESKALDVIYVSHIDADHIAGILQLMDDKVQWAIYDYQKNQGNKKFRKPKNPRPPDIKAVWHNAFDEQVGNDSAEIRDMLATSASILYGSDTRRFVEMAESYQELSTSVRQAINLSRRLGTGQLNIKLNPHADGKLMMIRKQNPPIKIGKMKWQIIGPFEEDLKKLKKEWDEWLADNKAALEKIEISSQKDEKKIGNLANREINNLLNTANFQANALGREFENLAQSSKSKKVVLGRRSNVTVPNLASLMFLVEEKTGRETKTILLTGDGHQDDILKGLEKAGKLDSDGNIHVDILKVQHHGSKNNIDRPFLKQITADNYVFCGNGGHHNPHFEVIDAVIDSRLVKRHCGKHPSAENSFKLWFNCNAENFEADEMSKSDKANQEHMKELEKIVTKREKASNEQMKSFFLKGSHFTIKI